MTLVWWKSGQSKPVASSLPNTGKFAARKNDDTEKRKEQANDEHFSLLPLFALCVLCGGTIAWTLTLAEGVAFLPFREFTILILIGLTGSAMMLSQRFLISEDKRRLYLPLTFAITIVTALLYAGVLPRITPESIALPHALLEQWGSYVVRVVFALLLLVSIATELRKSKEHINAAWFLGVAAIFIACGGAFLMLRLPDGFPFGIVPHAEEAIPLVLLIFSFSLLFHNGRWKTDKMIYHLLWLVILAGAGTTAMFFAPSTFHPTYTAGAVLYCIAVAIPFFSIQTSMHRSYRYAEEHRIREKWMTKQMGPNVGRELSPAVFREVAQQLHEGLALTDVAGRILFANKHLAEMTGRSEEQLAGKTPSSWQHSSTAADFYQRIFGKIQKEKTMYEGTVTNAYPLNPVKGYAAALRITPVLNEFGEISCFVLQQRSISEEEERAHLLRQMIDTMPLGVMLLKVPALSIELINTQAEYILSSCGFDLRSVRTFHDVAGVLKTMEGQPYAEAILPPALALAKKDNAEAKDIAVFGDTSSSPMMVWSMKAVPFIHTDGTIHSLLVSFDDISRHREYEHKMSDFISVASHQLRTPLTSIKWSLDMLRKPDAKISPEEHTLMFDTCYEAADRMMMTIQQLLQAAALEGSASPAQSGKVEIEEMIGQSLKSLKPMMDQKKIGFQQSVLKSIPPLHYNSMGLSQIVHNLIENAVKYTPEGGKIDSILTLKDSVVEWTLHDTGIGISKPNLGKLFQKFFRADNAQRMYPDGTGLGLYIVKSTLDASGGTIRIESEEGKGTTVYVTLPLTQKISEPIQMPE